ncbi:hypothetical protein Tco_0094210, partial [Tanacetum coccineum]
MFTMGASHTLEATHVEFFSDEDELEVDSGNSYTVPTTPNTRIHKDHPMTNVIGDVKSSVQTRRMIKPTSEQGFLSAQTVFEQSYYLVLTWSIPNNPTIHDSLVKQFWQTATASTLADGNLELRATIDTLEYTITDTFVRSKLQLADAS